MSLLYKLDLDLLTDNIKDLLNFNGKLYAS